MNWTTEASLREAIADLQRETGLQLRQDSATIAAYTANSAARLAAGAGQLGFLEAVKREAKNVVAFAAEVAVGAGDAGDARLPQLVIGVLIGAAG